MYRFFSANPYLGSLTPKEASSLNSVTIVYAGVSGTAKHVALEIKSNLSSLSSTCRAELYDVSEFDFDKRVLTRESWPGLIVFVISTYTDGAEPPCASLFMTLLADAAGDQRMDHRVLEGMKFLAVGLGDRAYGHKLFCVPAKTVRKNLAELGAHSVHDGGLNFGPSELTESSFVKIAGLIVSGLDSKAKSSTAGQQLPSGSKKPTADENESSGSSDEEHLSDEDTGVDELENTGGASMHLAPRQRKQLEKEGYKIVGSHSAVKLCRWTKHHIRGRGGCYKHTFYGISSSNCMEATPSLSCANKCVFCWRHHKNPVSKTFNWAQTDDPKTIVDGWMNNHRTMVASLKTVPGATPERLAEAEQIKHCALSLVGEPIMYPYINEALGLLHDRGVSTFMVTNAQFPDQLRDLRPVTQLYLSIDASNEEDLKRIDRPLHTDFYDRFLRCIDLLKTRTDRTVFRLTLVKRYNVGTSEMVAEYANLVARGLPDFIEVKSVTYSGADSGNDITMTDIPYHKEVLEFCAVLSEACNAVLESKGIEGSRASYEVACEHEHSCCVLIANKSKYHVNGKWHTWIDYSRFNSLASRSTGGDLYSGPDYSCETPEWAIVGHEQRGFDPENTRFYRKSKKAAVVASCT